MDDNLLLTNLIVEYLSVASSPVFFHGVEKPQLSYDNKIVFPKLSHEGLSHPASLRSVLRVAHA